MANAKIEDLRLPQAVISRIIKNALPPGAIISNEAKIAIARSAAIFILYATTYANENATSKKRKAVQASDVVHALKSLECEELEKPLLEAIEAWKNKKAQKTEERKKNKSATAAPDEPMEETPAE
uniref:DNA polymerase epsilon subunit 3 n=1 Tax=Acrobeloides nanus TaxID=290746 RepID=A0A914ELT2_9BILA